MNTVQEKGWQHPTGATPAVVAIVALGSSRTDFDFHQMRKGSAGLSFDEVWTVNRGGRLMQHDLLFVMDDLRREAYFDPEYGDFIQSHDRPIITSVAYPEFATEHPGGIHAYPLCELAAWCHVRHVRCYLKNSIPQMIAYAAFIGVEKLLIHGADYTLPNGQAMEPSRANVEYWVGVCEALGMDVGITPNGRLLGLQDFPQTFVYGYDLHHDAQRMIAEGTEIGAQMRILAERNNAA